MPVFCSAAGLVDAPGPLFEFVVSVGTSDLLIELVVSMPLDSGFAVTFSDIEGVVFFFDMIDPFPWCCTRSDESAAFTIVAAADEDEPASVSADAGLNPLARYFTASVLIASVRTCPSTLVRD